MDSNDKKIIEEKVMEILIKYDIFSRPYRYPNFVNDLVLRANFFVRYSSPYVQGIGDGSLIISSDQRQKVIGVRDGLSETETLFVIAYEIGHYFLQYERKKFRRKVKTFGISAPDGYHWNTDENGGKNWLFFSYTKAEILGANRIERISLKKE